MGYSNETEERQRLFPVESINLHPEPVTLLWHAFRDVGLGEGGQFQ